MSSSGDESGFYFTSIIRSVLSLQRLSLLFMMRDLGSGVFFFYHTCFFTTSYSRFNFVLHIKFFDCKRHVFIAAKDVVSCDTNL